MTVNLQSNNPFRNRTVSPPPYNTLPSPQSPSFNLSHTAPERPLSRNPFLDLTESKKVVNFQQRPRSPDNEMSRIVGNPSAAKAGGFMGSTVELFVRPLLIILLHALQHWGGH